MHRLMPLEALPLIMHRMKLLLFKRNLPMREAVDSHTSGASRIDRCALARWHSC